jgi:voltage-gated potassium channel
MRPGAPAEWLRVTVQQPVRNDPLVRMLGHTTVVLFLLTLGYYVLPLRLDWEGATPWRLAASVCALGLLVLVFRAQIRRSRQQTDRYLRIQWLLTALYGLVLTFALVYAFQATSFPDQFVGITDRTDALYFSVTIVSTVGFGDIHAAGTAARLVVTLHMVFNLVYLGTALRVLTGSASVPFARSDDERPTRHEG